CSSDLYWWWQPVVFGCCIVGVAGIVAMLVVSRERRRAALTLPVVVAAGYISVFLSGFPIWIYLYFLNPEFLVRSMEYRDFLAHPSLSLFLSTMSYVLHAVPSLALAAVCGIMRCWSMNKPQNGKALEDGEALPG